MEKTLGLRLQQANEYMRVQLIINGNTIYADFLLTNKNERIMPLVKNILANSYLNKHF